MSLRVQLAGERSTRYRSAEDSSSRSADARANWKNTLTPDRAVIHPTLPYLHIVHPLPASHTVPYPPSEEDLVKLADQLAPALMRVLDLAFDALRRSGGDRSQGWNMLMTL